MEASWVSFWGRFNTPRIGALRRLRYCLPAAQGDYYLAINSRGEAGANEKLAPRVSIRVTGAARTVAAFRVGTRLKQAVARTRASTRERPRLRKLLSRLTK